MEEFYNDIKNVFATLVEIDSPSLEEKKMAAHIREGGSAHIVVGPYGYRHAGLWEKGCLRGRRSGTQ